jgi:Zn ribbon nucleic-acid-binding protein
LVITKVLKLRWNNRIVKYYKDKGYEFTREHDFFEVDIKDLMPTSNYNVVVKCDECGSERSEPYYVAYPRIENGNLCSPCATRKSNPVGVATKIKKHGSFLDAAKDALGEDFLTKYWSDKNTIDPSSVCAGSKKPAWFKCQNVDYHDDYQISFRRFLKGGRCPQCYTKDIHPLDSLGQTLVDEYGEDFIQNRWSAKNKKTAFEYHPKSNRKIWLTCPDGRHDDYLQIVQCAQLAEFRCPQCTREHKKSRLQNKVEDYIRTEYGYEMLFEFDCNLHPQNPLTKQYFRYDIELPSLLLICEVNGAQHYKKSSRLTQFKSLKDMKTPEEELEYQQAKDAMKRDYAISHGYSFLEIPYTSEKNGWYKQLIDEAIFSA